MVGAFGCCNDASDGGLAVAIPEEAAPAMDGVPCLFELSGKPILELPRFLFGRDSWNLLV